MSAFQAASRRTAVIWACRLQSELKDSSQAKSEALSQTASVKAQLTERSMRVEADNLRLREELAQKDGDLARLNEEIRGFGALRIENARLNAQLADAQTSDQQGATSKTQCPWRSKFCCVITSVSMPCIYSSGAQRCHLLHILTHDIKLQQRAFRLNLRQHASVHLANVHVPASE